MWVSFQSCSSLVKQPPNTGAGVGGVAVPAGPAWEDRVAKLGVDQVLVGPAAVDNKEDAEVK